jgi:hypothetical protein
MNKTWKTLSEVNVNNDKERKGRFDYLSWADAWKHVQQNTENAKYELHDDVVYPDGTREVRCSVWIDGISHMMWLAVMDNNNRAIKNPDARAVNDARMRCLVKAIAMHGLGLYIYAGEDLPEVAAQQPAPKKAPPRKNPDIGVHPLEPEVQTFELYEHNGKIRDTFNVPNHYTEAYLKMLEKYQAWDGCTTEHIDAFKEKNKAAIDLLGSNDQTTILDKTKWIRTQVGVSK